MFVLAFRNISTSGYESTTEQGMPSWFATTQEKQNYVQNMDIWILAMISPIQFFFHSHSIQPKDTRKSFWLPFMYMNYPLDFKVRFHQSPL